MFERIVLFAYQLSKILEMAWEEVSDNDNHPRGGGYLGTEHMLIGLIRADKRVAKFFKFYGVSLEDLRERVKTNVSEEDIRALSISFPYMIGECTSTFEAWTVFCNVQQGTGRQNHDAASSLLDQLLNSDCEVARILSQLRRDMGVDVRKIHKEFRIDGLKNVASHPSQLLRLNKLRPF